MHTLRGAGSFIEEWFAMIYMGLWVLAFLAMLLGVRLKRVNQPHRVRSRNAASVRHAWNFCQRFAFGL
jgi:hypothetical protein